MSDLNTQTVSDLLRALDAGSCTSVDLVNDVLAAIDATEPSVKAYLSVDRERALRDAASADERRAAGDSAPLLGIPIAMKDVLNVTGDACTCASKLLQGYVAPYDATAVARLREAGAILLGRTNMDEFAMGSSTENSAYAQTCNPWSPDRVPGGSSGGSAAAVAARSAVAALGTDTGGSIRQPAAFCGCVGLKPSYGRVSRYGLTAYASSLDQIGPMTRSVEDAARILQVIAGDDPLDSTCADLEVPDYLSGLTQGFDGLRLGLPSEYFASGLDADVARAVDAAIARCKEAGAEVVEVHLPHTEYAVATYYVIATAEASANLARFDGVRYGARASDVSNPIDLTRKSRAAGFGDEVKRRIILGTYVLSSGYYDAYYLQAQKARTLIRQDFEAAFAQCDVLAAPVAPTTAYPIGSMSDDPLKMYLGDILTASVNLAGICGVSVPCGADAEGLPVGLQFIGPAFGEAELLRAAAAYEALDPWAQRAPSMGGAA